MQVSVRRIIGNVARNLGLSNPSEHLEAFVEWAFEAEGSRVPTFLCY